MIREWYIKEFPDDELGYEIDNSSTFHNLYLALNTYESIDVYNVIGVGDSLVRERLFNELANLLGVDYSVIYDLWLV